MKSIIFLLFLAFPFVYHADGIAEYQYSINENHIILKFEMDKNELKHYSINKECQKNKMFDICISNYLLSHSNLQLNGTNIIFKFEESSVYKDHIIFKFKSKNTYQKVNQVKIKNNCFYNVNSKFKNRILIDIGNFQKSFLLTKGKDSILLTKINNNEFLSK
ncbi:DUF6702 family protein [Tenacibaculum sp. nBUS_03]|uniref:DUF6702 family protein n=1 Tax=Tenacibaculum sp. nBUS_03 TaxID=3395320 RepID=UPI003EBEC7F4